MKENKTEKRNATQRKERRQIRRSAHRYHNKNNNNARASSAEKKKERGSVSDWEVEQNSPSYSVGHLDTSCVLPTKKNSPGSSPLVVQPQCQTHAQPWPGPGQHLANAKSLEIVFSSLLFFSFSPFPFSLFPPELPQPGHSRRLVSVSLSVSFSF